jgi:hypothetical protein
MRRGGVDPVVRPGVPGHERVELAQEVYDKASVEDRRQALRLIGSELLPQMPPFGSVQ